MNRSRVDRLASSLLVGAVVALTALPAAAHWCSNIFNGRARLIVKPEKSSVNVSGATKLRVHLKNNFPYRLNSVRMRGTASGYTISVSPSSSSGQTVWPGQTVSYMFTITGASGNLAVSKMNLQVRFRVGSWRSSSDSIVNPSPSQSSLISASGSGQSQTLNLATLADKFPSAKLSKFFNRTATQQLISYFGYRFCYNSSGSPLSSSCACPASSCPEGSHWTSNAQFPQNCMRAGVALAERKATLGSNLSAARNGAVNALKGSGSKQHKCLAAVVGGYLWQGASAGTFTSALNSSGLSTACKNAGLRALNGSSPSSCTSGDHTDKAACAGAEGLRNNNGPVKSVLIPNAGCGQTGVSGYTGLFYSYMLSIVTAHRMKTVGYASYYPDSGSSTPPKKDTGTPKKDTATPKKDTATPKKDTTGPKADSNTQAGDSSGAGDSNTIPGGDTDNTGRGDDGGCALGSRPVPSLLSMLVLVALFFRRRR